MIKYQLRLRYSPFSLCSCDVYLDDDYTSGLRGVLLRGVLHTGEISSNGVTLAGHRARLSNTGQILIGNVRKVR